jgi:wyosine [tRNA(Phe)-imidazoG37] synthetase (radical SAM superfamily)
LRKISPDWVQLNTVYRPPAEDFASPLEEERLREIEEDFGKKASIVAPYRRERSMGGKGKLEAQIIDALRRRPLTAEDMAEIFGLHPEELVKYLKLLRNSNTIRHRLHGRKIFYEIAS